MNNFKEWREKHRKDYKHVPGGRIGGNPRYSGDQGHDKPDPRNSREASKKALEREIKNEYETHLPSEDGVPFQPKTPKQLFNQLKLMQTGTRALAELHGVTSSTIGQALMQIEKSLQHTIGVLANSVNDEDWNK